MNFTGDENNLKEYKAWLFQENIRMDAEKKAMEAEKKKLLKTKKELEDQKQELEYQMRQLSDKIRYETERMDQERKFFDTKFKILENGFKQLAADKDKFEYEKKMFETMKKVNQYQDAQEEEYTYEYGSTYTPIFFFKGVTSPLGLKKRYKDLIKIFHPDNLFGDNETILKINKEYEMMKKKFNYQKKTV